MFAHLSKVVGLETAGSRPSVWERKGRILEVRLSHRGGTQAAGGGSCPAAAQGNPPPSSRAPPLAGRREQQLLFWGWPLSRNSMAGDRDESWGCILGHLATLKALFLSWQDLSSVVRTLLFLDISAFTLLQWQPLRQKTHTHTPKKHPYWHWQK